MGKFNLVDFAAQYQKGFRNHIVPIGEVPALVKSFKRYGCYATYSFYSDEVLFLPIDLDHPDLAPALEAAIRNTVDLAIKDRVRLLRLPNTFTRNRNSTKSALVWMNSGV
jgi:hypothetical protein